MAGCQVFMTQMTKLLLRRLKVKSNLPTLIYIIRNLIRNTKCKKGSMSDSHTSANSDNYLLTSYH